MDKETFTQKESLERKEKTIVSVIAKHSDLSLFKVEPYTVPETFFFFPTFPSVYRAFSVHLSFSKIVLYLGW